MSVSSLHQKFSDEKQNALLFIRIYSPAGPWRLMLPLQASVTAGPLSDCVMEFHKSQVVALGFVSPGSGLP